MKHQWSSIPPCLDRSDLKAGLDVSYSLCVRIICLPLCKQKVTAIKCFYNCNKPSRELTKGNAGLCIKKSKCNRNITEEMSFYIELLEQVLSHGSWNFIVGGNLKYICLSKHSTIKNREEEKCIWTFVIWQCTDHFPEISHFLRLFNFFPTIEKHSHLSFFSQL